jgi:hypothetical protein
LIAAIEQARSCVAAMTSGRLVIEVGLSSAHRMNRSVSSSSRRSPDVGPVEWRCRTSRDILEGAVS